MSALLQDLRYALRRLRLSPGFALVCIVTLALGIGANTAIFTLVDAVLLKSLPVTDPSQLYRVGNANNCCAITGMQGSWDLYSDALYKQLRDHTPQFSQMAAFQAELPKLNVRRSSSTGLPQAYGGEFVSGNYFSMFGVKSFAGRTIMPTDDRRGAAPVAMMSYRTWEGHFGRNPSVIGATFIINTMAYTVVGIAPPGFFGDTLRPDPPDFWLPLSTEPALDQQNELLTRADLSWLHAIGRLKPGARPAQVQAEVTLELQRWLSAQPNLTAYDRTRISKQRIIIAPGGAGVTEMQRQTQAELRLLMIVAGFVLLIACANVANLFLARATAAHADTAIRLALGAPRGRLIRQMITESVVFAILGGLAGLTVAFVGARAILLIAFRGFPYVPISATPSFAVLGFAFLVSLVTGVLFGAAPAWVASHSQPADALHGAGRSARDHTSVPQRSLVLLQVAFSISLLVGAGLLTESLRNIESQNFGFDPNRRLIVRVDPALSRYKPDQLYGLYQQLQDQLPRIPGVLSASYSLYSPMRGDNWDDIIHIEGRPPEERDDASYDRVGPHYFQTIGTRLLRGRTIDAEDTPASQKVAVINQAFAHKFFPKQDPIGRHFGIGGESHAGDFKIVGIVQDAKYFAARQPAHPTFFLPFLQTTNDPRLYWLVSSQYIGDIELKVAGRPQNLEAAVRRALANINPNLTVLEMVSLKEQLDRNFNQDELVARLTELFGLLALILACVGLYGVTSYSVARRTGEIGLRMALGANRRNVLWLILRGALLQVGIGLAIGIPITLAGGRLMAGLLYGVKSYNPVILGLATCVLAACAIAASVVPARRAASIDPIQALRIE
jgi:predicted permease